MSAALGSFEPGSIGDIIETAERIMIDGSRDRRGIEADSSQEWSNARVKQATFLRKAMLHVLSH